MLALQSSIIAAQQPPRACDPLLDRHAKAGTAAQNRTATNIVNAPLLPKVMLRPKFLLQESALVYRGAVICVTRAPGHDSVTMEFKALPGRAFNQRAARTPLSRSA